MKRRHLLLMALSLILTICMCFAFAGCDSCSDDEAPAKLSTPVVTIDDNGVASWLEVENASGYAFVIDNGNEVATTQLSVNLTDGQSVKVKAKGDGENYSDSDFSEPKTYTAPAKQPTKLASPEVTIASDGTVTIGAVEHASKIVYVIGDGAETDYDASDKPVLTDGQTIKVTAKGDGTNYSDSDVVEKTHNATQPSGVMTHAEFVAAEKATDVTVQGVVTAFVKTEKYGYNIYMQDSDGGYYIYGTTGDVAQTFAIGVTIKAVGAKDVYNGLHQVKNATVEITNATATQVTPVDVTDKVGNNDALLALQSSYVTVKGATITEVSIDSEKNRTNVTLTVDGKTILFYIGGSQVINSDQQSEISKNFNDNKGKTVDVTAIVSLFSNTAQLIPANATPISNIQTTLEELDAPVVSVDQTTGKATWGEVANATKYVYKIGENGTETDAPANREVPLQNKGDKIYVKAIGDGTTYGDSDWSIVKVWSNVDPDTLPALDMPATVTVSEDGLTITWAAVTGAAGYKYAVGDGADVEVNALTVTLDTALTAGQTVKVKAVGDLINNKDSEYKTATYVAKLEAPVVEIDDNGVVTVTADTNAVKVVYVIGDSAEADYSADNKPTLTNGQKITVTAKGNGTAYADSDPVEKTYVALMTHAEYAAAAEGANVCVKGIVTAFRSNNIFLSDNDGGYYAFRVTAVPEGLAVGVEIKVTGTKTVFNGLDEITSATVAITNATPATVNPVDITATLSAATAATDADLLALQNTYVTVKGVTITSNNTGSTVTVAIGSLSISYYVGGTTQVVDADQQTEIKNAFAANNGRTADVTAIVAIRNGAIQFVPANAAPLSNIVLPQLSAPSVEIDEETGVATISNIDENGKAVYSIDGAEFADYDAENKPVVPYGKTIVVKAVNDGNYEESATASATYDAEQIKLDPPAFTIGATSGEVRITITEDDHATGYKYTVLDAEGNEVAGKVDQPYDPENKPVLENGQQIKIMSVGGARYQDSDYSAPVKFTKTNKVGTPVLSVDVNGNVSWQETDGSGFTYKVKGKDAADYGAPETVTKATRTVQIQDGATIQVMANKDATKDGTENEQEDSDWSEELKYLAPSQRTEGIPTDFAFTKVENQVKLTFTANSEIVYMLTLNEGTAQKVENGEILIDIAEYSVISLTVVGTTTGDPQAKGDYSNLFVDKDIDLKEIYDTTFYNGYKAEQKVAAAKTALNGYLTTPVVASFEKILATSLEGAEYADVTISWSLTPGSVSAVYTESDNKLVITPDNLTDPKEETVTITATISCNGKSDTLPFEITVKKLVTTSETFTFSTMNFSNQQAINKVEGESIVLQFEKNTGTTQPQYLTGSLGVRVYTNSKLTVKSNDNLLITKIEFSFKDNHILVATAAPSGTLDNNVWSGSATEISFVVDSSSNKKDILSIIVTYEAPDFTDEQKVDKALATLPTSLNEKYNANFVLSTESKFDLVVVWSATTTAGDATVTFDGGNATVTRGESDSTVKIIASITSGSVTKTKDYTITVEKKIAEGDKTPITRVQSFEDTSKSNGAAITTIGIENDSNITMEFSKASGSNAPCYYSTSPNYIRTYANNTATISVANGYTIVSVKITFVEKTSSNKTGKLTCADLSDGNLVSGTLYTLSTDKQSISITTNTQQVGYRSIEITYKPV